MHENFRRFARHTSNIAGSPWTFCIALAAIVLWAVSGPVFGFSTSWQLLVNTGTTILTFLMVFLIQNTQNRDAHAVHLKLDELIKALKGARNQLIDIEDGSEEVLAALEHEYSDLKRKQPGA